jgi:hypothetical protein
MMERMIAYCGLVCSTCPLFVATRANDEKEARRVAALLKREYGIDAAAGDIQCDGCVGGGRLYVNCARCEIRPCAIGRGVSSCGACPDFPCMKIEAFLKAEPAARDALVSRMNAKQ